MSTIVQDDVTPARLRELGADYADTFTRHAVAPPTARRAAEQALAGATAMHGLFAKAIWRGALGLGVVAVGTPGTVAGWAVVRDEPDHLLLVADGPRMRGQIVFTTTATSLTWTTALEFRHPSARPTWAVAGHVHRALVPPLLARVRS